MQVDRLNILYSTFHVVQELFNCSFEGALVRLKAHTRRGVKLDPSGDSVLLCFILHFTEDELSRFLVDSDLSFDHTIVNEADESTETLVVVSSKMEDLIFEVALFLLQNNRFLLLSLAFLRVLKVFFFA